MTIALQIALTIALMFSLHMLDLFMKSTLSKNQDKLIIFRYYITASAKSDITYETDFGCGVNTKWKTQPLWWHNFYIDILWDCQWET